MPKAARASKATKKKVTKTSKVAPKKVAKTVAKSSNSSTWNTPYLHKEQQDFHKNHPNAKMLITAFIVLTVIFLVLYIFPMTQ
jgi:hypothetical protein